MKKLEKTNKTRDIVLNEMNMAIILHNDNLMAPKMTGLNL